MGLTFSGCAVAIVSLFLPLLQQPSVLQQVNDNSMIQSHGFGSALIVLAVIVALLLSWAYYNRAAGAGNPRFEGRKPSWGVAVCGIIPIVEACVVLGSSDFGQLYGAQSGAYVEVGAGMALYLLLFGASLIVAGGLMMWRSAYVPDVSNQAAPTYNPPPEPPTAPPEPRASARPDTIAETEPQSDSPEAARAVSEQIKGEAAGYAGFILIWARGFLGITVISILLFAAGVRYLTMGPADLSAAYIGGAYVAAVMALSLAYYFQTVRYVRSQQIPSTAHIAAWGVGVLSLLMSVALGYLTLSSGGGYLVIPPQRSASGDMVQFYRGIAIYLVLACSIVLTLTGIFMTIARITLRNGTFGATGATFGEGLSDEEKLDLLHYLRDGDWKPDFGENDDEHEFLASPPVSEMTPTQVSMIRQRIKVLKMRRDSGSISAEEFEAQKAELFRQI